MAKSKFVLDKTVRQEFVINVVDAMMVEKTPPTTYGEIVAFARMIAYEGEYIAEQMPYFEGLSVKGMDRLIQEISRTYQAQKQAAENLRVIKENAAKIAEYDNWAAGQDAAGAAATTATLLTVGDLRFVTQVIDDEQTLFLAVVYDFMNVEWRPRDGVVYHNSGGWCDKLVTDRFQDLAAITFENAVDNVVKWLMEVEPEPEPEPEPAPKPIEDDPSERRSPTIRQRTITRLASEMWFEHRVSCRPDWTWINATFLEMAGDYWTYYQEAGAAEMLEVLTAAEKLAVSLQEVL